MIIISFEGVNLALSIASHFRLKLPEAKQLQEQLKSVFQSWSDVAQQLGAHRSEISLMEGVFAI